MYVFNLCPFPVKGVSHLYAWMTIPVLKNFPHDEVTFIGAPHQLQPPETVTHAPWVYELAGDLPEEFDWPSIRKLEVPGEMVRRIADSVRDPKTLLAGMILDGFHEYREWLYRELVELHERQRIKAVITFVNCASLEAVCRYLGIPVVHMEAGFMRQPVWKVSTFQFDFRGVNGNTEAADRFIADRRQERGRCNPEKIADMLLSKECRNSFQPAVFEYTYEFGVPLQVEDDSNIVAFGCGLNNIDSLYVARQVFPPNLILARNHPLALMKLGEHPNIAVIDTAANSIEFVAKCKRILTINSSVAFEALMMGRATYVLGESPLGHVASRSVDRHLRGESYGGQVIDDYLDFLTFQYLIPSNLWMDKEYLDFRLSRPSEGAIRERHLAALTEMLR